MSHRAEALSHLISMATSADTYVSVPRQLNINVINGAARLRNEEEE